MAIQTLNPISDPEEIRKEMAANTQPLNGAAGQGTAATPVQSAAPSTPTVAPAPVAEPLPPAVEVSESPVAEATPVAPDTTPESVVAETSEAIVPPAESQDADIASPATVAVTSNIADAPESIPPAAGLPTAEQVAVDATTGQETPGATDAVSPAEEEAINTSIEAISTPETAPDDTATPTETPVDATEQPVVAAPSITAPTPVAEEPKPTPIVGLPAEKKPKAEPEPQPQMPDGVPFMGKVSSGGDATPVSVELSDPTTAAVADVKDEQTPPEDPPAKSGFLGLFSKKK